VRRFDKSRHSRFDSEVHMGIFDRTEALIGSDGLAKLRKARVAVFGVGGVGGHVCEALARSGVGELHLVDMDRVSETNINRQIIALHSTVGRYKTEVMAERIRDISPQCKVMEFRMFYLPQTADEIDLSAYDYVVDAVDTVSAKIELALRAEKAGVPLISSMGTGNKLHPEMLEITDIYKTSTCPLARVMRKELKARGVSRLTVLYSAEPPIPSVIEENGRHAPASTPFVPGAAGLIIAAHVVRELVGK